MDNYRDLDKYENTAIFQAVNSMWQMFRKIACAASVQNLIRPEPSCQKEPVKSVLLEEE